MTKRTILPNFISSSRDTLKQDLAQAIKTFQPQLILLERLKAAKFPDPMQIDQTRVYTRLTLHDVPTKTLTNSIPKIRKQTHWLSVEPVTHQQATWLALQPMIDAIHITSTTKATVINKHSATQFWRHGVTIEFDLTPLIYQPPNELSVTLRTYRKILKKLNLGRTRILLLSGKQGYYSLRSYRSLEALSAFFGLGFKHLYKENRDAAFLEGLLETNQKKLQKHIINGAVEVLPIQDNSPSPSNTP